MKKGYHREGVGHKSVAWGNIYPWTYLGFFRPWFGCECRVVSWRVFIPDFHASRVQQGRFQKTGWGGGGGGGLARPFCKICMKKSKIGKKISYFYPFSLSFFHLLTLVPFLFQILKPENLANNLHITHFLPLYPTVETFSPFF